MPRSALIPAGLHVVKSYLLTRRRVPLLASFKLTYRCNLRCLQCPFCDMTSPQLTFLDARAVIERLHRRGNRLLIFEGGEPMLWHDGNYTLADLAAEAKKHFYATGMTTNGTFPIDSDLARVLDVIWFSIDGFAETHDRLRGKPVFEHVLQNIRASRHPRIYAHITINNQNDGEVPELVRFLSQVVRGITIQFYYPYNHKDELFLDFDRRADLLDRLIALKRSGLPLMNSTASLNALKFNTWRCADWLIDSANPDGSIRQGCYLRGRSDIDCVRCGFSPHTEASLAYQGSLRAVLAGIHIFF